MASRVLNFKLDWVKRRTHGLWHNLYNIFWLLIINSFRLVKWNSFSLGFRNRQSNSLKLLTLAANTLDYSELKVAFFSHKREITNLVFLEPFSVLFTSSKDGISCLWDCQDYKNLKTRCIGRLKNMSWYKTKLIKSGIHATVNILSKLL